jgi:hypothetical protein
MYQGGMSEALAVPTKRSTWPTDSRSLIVGGLAAFAFAIFLFDPSVLNDADTYWHLAAGDWMLTHREVLHRDVFSHTYSGEWETHEWLSEIIMALAYRAGGWNGIVLLFGAAMALTAGLLGRELSRSLSGLSLAVILIVAGGCIAPSMLTRPHILMLPILVVWTAGLMKAREAGKAPPLAMALLVVLWANLHGSYVFAFVLAGLFGLEALAAAAREDRLKVVRDWGLFGALTLLAAMTTPHGVSGLIYPIKLMSMTTLPAINEWRSMDFSRPGAFEAALIATLFVGFSRGVKVAPLRLALLLLLLHMTLQHARHQMVLAIVAPLLMAQPFAAALGQTPAAAAWRARTAIAVFLALAIPLSAVRLLMPLERHDDGPTPMTALAHVPAAIAARPVLNDYSFGGYLIFKGVKPFIDGRSDMYGDAFFKEFLKANSGNPAALERVLTRYHVEWTILRPGEALTGVMDARPGWRRLYADKHAVVHVRDPAPQTKAP